MLRVNLRRKSLISYEVVVSDKKKDKKLGSIVLKTDLMSNMSYCVNIAELRFWLKLGAQISERGYKLLKPIL